MVGVVIFTVFIPMMNHLQTVGDIDDGLSEVTSLGFGVSNATGTLIYTSSGATTLSVTGTLSLMILLKPLQKIMTVGILYQIHIQQR